MEKCYLWQHEPMISDEPVRLIHHRFFEKAETVYQAAVLELANGKYLFISFMTEEKSRPEVGITDFEEFDNEKDAAKLYLESCEVINEFY